MVRYREAREREGEREERGLGGGARELKPTPHMNRRECKEKPKTVPNTYCFRGSHLSTMVCRDETNVFHFLLSFAGGGCHLFVFRVVSLGPARLPSIPCTCADQGALSPARTGRGVFQGSAWLPHVFLCRFGLSVFCWLLLFWLSTVFPFLMSR